MMPSGPAKQSGLVLENDVLFSVNGKRAGTGQELENSTAVRDWLAAVEENGSVQFRLVRRTISNPQVHSPYTIHGTHRIT